MRRVKLIAIMIIISLCTSMIGISGCEKMENFEEKYSSIKVVYDEYGRKYGIQAADKAVEIINEIKPNFASKVDCGDYVAKDGEYVLYIGECSQTNSVWDGYIQEGYIIKAEKGYSIIRGNCVEYTYAAMNKYFNEEIKGELQNFSKLAHDKYSKEVEITREDYIDNIDLFPLVWEYEWTSPEWLHDFDEKTMQFKSSSGRPMIFGHRGDIESYPENSIEGFISAIKRGVDAIEIDIWKTSDGVYVLNHAKELHETTDWMVKKGKTIDGVKLPISDNIIDWSYEQLQKLNLRFGCGQYSSASSEITTFKIATLEETLKICKDRVYLTMDRMNYDLNTGATLSSNQMGLNNPNWDGVYSLMKKTGSFVTLYCNFGLTVKDTDDLRKIVNTEQNLSTPTQFDRAGWHNAVVDWYAEFTCSDFDALYNSYMTEGNPSTGTPAGNFLMVNRPSKCVEFVDKYYRPKN